MGTHAMLPERLLTIAEVADYLGVPVGTLYQWRHKRTGPKGIRVGRHVRYRPREVEAWLDSLARDADRPGDRPPRLS
jgi:excisionase family DNA binding protein